MLAQVLRQQGYAQYRARLSDLLGVAPDASDIEVHRAVNNGIPAKLLMALAEKGEIAPQERDQVIPLKTLKSRIDKAQALSQVESDRLFRIAHVRAMAEAIFGDQVKARRWLSKPKTRFDGASPASMLTTLQGCHLVEEMLIQIAEGYAF
ncbi:antitoxin Xre/MbcA/ParS toxin-binding domain-containing protein (plasmid) [Stutzerimonas frequens]|uniref:antitoxin Xre/MbcA/ParS toxin-binding domain-containing protein n=1 Tax=Stutzerimonas frequens TaxID=2968969 RepID=UPI002DB627D0|nr:antitoxin Xre/MbcA/ParS toxin-binding domain-containing protein [Stutzerimonas frequens]WRW29365.1 antitoxin Xre/MbcA/ParS toxin-binding domain-containing protein [Stutzerimonas frequens]